MRYLANALVTIAGVAFMILYPHLWILGIAIIFLGWQEKDEEE